jgi:nucleolar complex protein 2
VQQRSLKALRKVLLCFKVASSAGDEDERSAATKKGGKAEQYSIPNAVVFNNVVTVALKYTPLVLNHHVPVKEMANGKL